MSEQALYDEVMTVQPQETFLTDDLVYEEASDLSEVSDERPRVNLGPVISLSMTSYDSLAASFVQNPLPSTEELDLLTAETGLDRSEVRWFFLKVKHLVQQEDGCQSGDTLYLETLKFIYNSVNDNGDEIMIFPGNSMI
mgnify:CR=1 FL=1